MNTISRRNFLELTALGLSSLAVGPAWSLDGQAGAASGNLQTLYNQFKDPERRFSIRPFWFWNGKLDGAELRRQIKQMVDHGVYGAYAHNRDGLQTPYLSEAWWQVLGEALQAARENGFSLCMVDEFEWPSGEARDYWLPGANKSRVVAANADFHMRRLRARETPVQGPRHFTMALPPETIAAVAGKLAAHATLEGDSLKALPLQSGARQIEWDTPEGDWIVFTYSLETSIGQPDHGTVDLMSREAVAKYIEIYYDEFHRRYGEYLGNAMPATFADHEGTYGNKLPWTPALLDTFRRKAGYALEPYLPALTYDIGAKTEKVRCDLLDTVSELYSNNFFQQVTDWCRQHHVDHSGHVWEESLFFGPAVQGDFFRILRSMSNPGCDTLVEWGRQSVWLKEVASVADFESRHVVCENQGVQGEDSYLSPEGMKRVSNCLGAWNIGEFVPHAFDYDLSRINFPPDWFRSQPYLPWFRAYADQMRRISFINCESHHVADIVLLYPQVSIWGRSAPAFRSESLGHVLNNSSWSEDAVDTNEQYAMLKLQLSEERLDYKVADDHYIAQSRTGGKRLRIADSDFSVMILPPMTTTRRSTAAKIRDYFQSGGTVIALRQLPVNSVEEGRNDPALQAIWEQTFDSHPTSQPFRLKQNSAGGRAYFVPGSVPDLIQALREAIDPDVEVVDGPTDHLYVLHKIKSGVHLYWIVNDTAEPRTNTLRLRARGRPERWNAHTAERLPLFYQTLGEKTLVRLTLGPWDAAYVAFDDQGPEQPLALNSTNLDELYVAAVTDEAVTVRGRALPASSAPLFAVLNEGQKQFRGEYKPASMSAVEITGEWNVAVEDAPIPLPYALTINDPGNRGMLEQWFASGADRLQWNHLWLSPMSNSIREWNVIGPFPDPADDGLSLSFPPEKAVDYSATYKGSEDRLVHWSKVNAADYRVAPAPGGWSLGTAVIGGGPYGAESFIVNYGEPLRVSPLAGVVYVQTNVYSPGETDASMVLVASNPRAVFLNEVQVYSRFLRPLYNQMTDGFADRIPLRLNAGWNSVMLKFLHNPADEKGADFTCRIEGAEGAPLTGLIASSRKLESPHPAPPRGYRWLRFPVPALAGALHVPPLQFPWLAFVDAKAVQAASDIPLPKGARFVTLRVAANEPLQIPFSFSPVSASLPLGTWSVPGMEYYSGRITYEKDVEVPESLLSERVLLDCGKVGVAAEAWVNGHAVGSRPWAPYVFDVSSQLHAGSNRIKVRVANTAANASAVGVYHDTLKNIDCNGWYGPARLAPYVDREIRCTRV